MGSIFGFVCSDVKSKVEILEEFRANAEVAEKFETVKQMIIYEREKELLQKKDYVSGCRTLLRLHRGLGELVQSTITEQISIKIFSFRLHQKFPEKARRP